MQEELITIVQGYSLDSYFPYGQISQRRQQSVIHNYGVDPRDTIIAVLDATIMGFTQGGSAEKGMALTLKGIYWKNLWTVKSRRNHYTWEELSQISQRLEPNGGNVLFEPGVEFYVPAQMKPPQVINLLQTVAQHYLELKAAMPGAVTGEAEPAPAAAISAAPSTPAPLAGPAGLYETALVNAMALLVCHAGNPDEACLELAIAFISGDEYLANKEAVLARLSSTAEAITIDAGKAPAFLKLRQSRLLAECRPVGASEFDGISIMLEGLEAAVADVQRDAVNKLAESIRKTIAPR